MRKAIGILLALYVLAFASAGKAQGNAPPSVLSSVAGTYNARNYAQWRDVIHVAGGGSIASGSGVSISLRDPVVRLADGRTIIPFYPGVRVTLGAGAAQETDAITSVTGCYLSAQSGSCTIVVTTTNQHGNGEPVTSGSLGLDEAIVDAASGGNGLANPSSDTVGGEVDVDAGWTLMGGTSTLIRATTETFPSVVIKDARTGATQYWTVQEGATVLAAPTVLTAVTALPSTTPAGSYGTGTYHLCIAYVDALGQEGPCSADFSEAGLASGSFIFSAPAASTGAVGWVPYISLTSGSYTLAYKVPLTTQPTVLGSYPAGNGNCTLTTAETITPACAMTATATVTAITVNTSPIPMQETVVSTTSVYVPNPGGRTTLVFVPGSHVGTPGIPVATLPFTITTAVATIVPNVLGSVNIRPGFMNFVGKTLEVCGEATSTATAATIEDIQFQWDSFGQNTAGKGVLIGDLSVTNTLATTGHLTFCQDFQTTVAAATATGGSINRAGGFVASAGVTTAAASAGGDVVTPGAIASLNLADEARINVIYLHTTATDGAGWILQNLTAKVVN